MALMRASERHNYVGIMAPSDLCYYLARARMSPSPDPAEPVVAGFVAL